MKLFSLAGQVAVVTGGAGGLGYDIADVLAAAGCHLILTSRTPVRAVQPLEQLRERHSIDAIVVKLDQREYESVQKFAEEAKNWKGRVDILVNNAGGSGGSGEGGLLRRPPQEIADVVACNLTGVLYCCREIGRIMAEQRRGKIINIASVSGLVGRNREIYRKNGVRDQPVDYAAAKAGVIGMTRDLAAYMAEFNVQVNAISPGGFDKGTLPPGFISDYRAMTPQKRMGRMGEDIKGAALFLASAGSDHVTGQNLAVDGGFSTSK